MAGHPLGPGTRPPPGWGAVIKGEHGEVAPGTSMKLARGGQRQGGAGATPANAGSHADAMNAYAFEKQMNIHEHKEKLGAQLEFNERDRANETAHHAERMGNELGFHALKQLSIRDANDAIDVREMHRHLSAGNPEGAQEYANRYNGQQALHQQSTESRVINMGGENGQLGAAVQEAQQRIKATADPDATGGFTPVDKAEAKLPVKDENTPSEREASDKVGAKAPENPPEASTPPTNVPGATENVTSGVDEPLKDKPVVKEANKNAVTPPQPVATPPSAAGNPATNAPTPQDQKAAVSESVSDRVTNTLPEGIPAVSKGPDDTDEIPAQQKEKAEAAAAAASAPGKVRGALQRGKQRVAAGVADFQEKAAARKVENDAAEAKLDQEREERRKAAAVGAPSASAPSDSDKPSAVTPADARPPSGRSRSGFDAGRGSVANAANPYQMSSDEGGHTQPLPVQPMASEAGRRLEAGEGRGAKAPVPSGTGGGGRTMRDIATVAGSTAVGAAKGLAEGNLVSAAAAAAGPEGPVVAKAGFVARGAAKGAAKGGAKVAAKHAAEAAVDKARNRGVSDIREGLARHAEDRKTPPTHADAKPGRTGRSDARLLPDDHPDAGMHNIEVRAHAKAHGYKPLPPSKKKEQS